MAESNADKLVAVLNGDPRYGIEIDSALRTIGHALPAAVCLKWFATLDESSPLFRQSIMDMLKHAQMVSGERLYEIRLVDESDKELPEKAEDEFTTAVRIRFSDEKAAYYQYHIFPPDLDYVSGCSRKRDGASQVMLLTLRSKKHLDDFIAVCRRNPHFVGIETISEEEFWKAPSNGV
jgi:hypothetical protein